MTCLVMTLLKIVFQQQFLLEPEVIDQRSCRTKALITDL